MAPIPEQLHVYKHLSIIRMIIMVTVCSIVTKFLSFGQCTTVHHQLDTTMAQVKQLQQELITISERLNGTEKPSPNITTTTGAVLNLSCTTEKITACHISASESNAPFSLCETTPAQLDKTVSILVIRVN